MSSLQFKVESFIYEYYIMFNIGTIKQGGKRMSTQNIIKYFCNLDWQEQDELMAELDKIRCPQDIGVI